MDHYKSNFETLLSENNDNFQVSVNKMQQELLDNAYLISGVNYEKNREIFMNELKTALRKQKAFDQKHTFVNRSIETDIKFYQPNYNKVKDEI